MYDLAVIGAGWAGFNATVRAKELGLKVCLIDSHKVGGTCLHYGCIPTKTLIASAKVFSLTKRLNSFGVELENPRVKLATIQEKKNKVIFQLMQGMQSRLVGVDFINALAQVVSSQEIRVGDRTIRTKFILIATGSRSFELGELKFNQKNIISSDAAIALTEVPQSLLVVGGGVIGCEFASLFSMLGSQVMIIEKTSSLLPNEDKEISRKIEVIFKKKGIQVVTGADISTFDLNNYSKTLICVGRRPHAQGLGLDNLGIELKDNRIVVDDYLKSGCDNIYAAGDCTGQRMLAHYAAYQGVMAVENMFSTQRKKADNLVVPTCIFTEPQIASVGLSQEAAVKAGLKIKVHKFDFRASAMAQIIDEVDGFVKIISNQENDQIIGASIIGPQATELISTLVVAISSRLTITQIRQVIFAHPTFSEAIQEAVKN